MRFNNNANAVRLMLAYGVLLYHVSLAISPPFLSPFPFVACFLTLSGFLVLKSRESSRGTGHFLWKRFLRIWPAMAVCGALTALCHPADRALFILRKTFFIGGPDAGSYFTITTEEMLYLFLAIAFAVGAYRLKIAPWLGLAISLASSWYFVGSNPGWLYVQRLVPMFFVGNLMYLYRERILWSPWLAAVGVLAFCLSVWLNPNGGQMRELLMQFSISYPLIWFALYAPPILSWVGRWGDPSYSLFLYHFALYPAVLQRVLPNPSYATFCLALTASALPIAYVSWHLMEKPALALKDWRWANRLAVAAPISRLAQPVRCDLRRTQSGTLRAGDGFRLHAV